MQQLDALLREVVPQQTVSDVPVGVFLSGGMDSALTAYYLDAPRTYTLGFEAGGRSEADAARQVAQHLDTRAFGNDWRRRRILPARWIECRRFSTSPLATARPGRII